MKSIYLQLIRVIGKFNGIADLLSWNKEWRVMTLYTKSGLLSVFLSLLVAATFISCGDDEESPDPSGNLPNANFELVSWDHIEGKEINDYEAPASFKLAFDITALNEMHTWTKLEIDFGNGTDTIMDPYEGQNLYFLPTYYSAGNYTVTLKASNSAGTAEFSQALAITPMTSIDMRFVEGFWSIIREEVSHANGNSTIQIEPYKEFFQFGSASYERWSLSWAEYESGSLAVNGKELELSTPGGPGITVTVDSFYRMNGIPVMSARTSILDADFGQVNYNLILQFDPRFVEGAYPPYSLLTTFYDNKWSIIEEEIWKYEFSDQSLQFNKIVDNWPKQTIPYNHFTIEYANGYIIDNWKEGEYDVMNNARGVIHNMSFTNIDGDEVYLLFEIKQFTSPDDDLLIWSTTFVDEGNDSYRYESRTRLKKSDGSEAVIERDSLVGSWEITSKTETIDGITVDPGNSQSPKVGDMLSFNADGSANLGGTGENWFVLDDCNFVLLPEGGDTVLVHLNSYDAQSSTIEILSISHEAEDNYKLVFEMLKL